LRIAKDFLQTTNVMEKKLSDPTQGGVVVQCSCALHDRGREARTTRLGMMGTWRSGCEWVEEADETAWCETVLLAAMS
jgi:hypothetical protein